MLTTICALRCLPGKRFLSRTTNVISELKQPQRRQAGQPLDPRDAVVREVERLERALLFQLEAGVTDKQCVVLQKYIRLDAAKATGQRIE